jgi:hypothetical protein
VKGQDGDGEGQRRQQRSPDQRGDDGQRRDAREDLEEPDQQLALRQYARNVRDMQRPIERDLGDRCVGVNGYSDAARRLCV